MPRPWLIHTVLFRTFDLFASCRFLPQHENGMVHWRICFKPATLTNDPIYTFASNHAQGLADFKKIAPTASTAMKGRDDEAPS